MYSCRGDGGIGVVLVELETETLTWMSTRGSRGDNYFHYFTDYGFCY